MKVLYCTLQNEIDVNKIISGQIDKHFASSERYNISVDRDNIKESILNALNNSGIKDDEYVLFFPKHTVLVEKPNQLELEKVISCAKKHELKYVKLQRVGGFRANKVEKDLDVYYDGSRSFFLVPYIILFSTLKSFVNKVKTRNDFFWPSLETSNVLGGVYFKFDANEKEKLSYWKNRNFHTISSIITHDHKWQDNYLSHNNGVLAKLIKEYAIDISERGTSAKEGCCK